MMTCHLLLCMVCSSIVPNCHTFKVRNVDFFSVIAMNLFSQLVMHWDGGQPIIQSQSVSIWRVGNETQKSTYKKTNSTFKGTTNRGANSTRVTTNCCLLYSLVLPAVQLVALLATRTQPGPWPHLTGESPQVTKLTGFPVIRDGQQTVVFSVW